MIVVTDKYAIYLLISSTWLSDNIDALMQMENCDSKMLQTSFSLISLLAMLKMFDNTFIQNTFLRFPLKTNNFPFFFFCSKA